MKEYYLKQFQASTLRLEIARIGYEQKMKVLATKLATADESQHGAILEAINDLRTVLCELIDDAKKARKRYKDCGGIDSEETEDTQREEGAE